MRVNNQPGVNQKQATETASARQTRGTAADQKTKIANNIDRATSTGDASAEISTRARDLARAKEIATQAPDAREAKIAELKRRIANNEYNVSPDKIADRLVDEHIQEVGIKR